MIIVRKIILIKKIMFHKSTMQHAKMNETLISKEEKRTLATLFPLVFKMESNDFRCRGNVPISKGAVSVKRSLTSRVLTTYSVINDILVLLLAAACTC